MYRKYKIKWRHLFVQDKTTRMILVSSWRRHGWVRRQGVYQVFEKLLLRFVLQHPDGEWLFWYIQEICPGRNLHLSTYWKRLHINFNNSFFLNLHITVSWYFYWTKQQHFERLHIDNSILYSYLCTTLENLKKRGGGNNMF